MFRSIYLGNISIRTRAARGDRELTLAEIGRFPLMAQYGPNRRLLVLS